MTSEPDLTRIKVHHHRVQCVGRFDRKLSPEHTDTQTHSVPTALGYTAAKVVAKNVLPKLPTAQLRHQRHRQRERGGRRGRGCPHRRPNGAVGVTRQALSSLTSLLYTELEASPYAFDLQPTMIDDACADPTALLISLL